jgi:hypothetical protein
MIRVTCVRSIPPRLKAEPDQNGGYREDGECEFAEHGLLLFGIGLVGHLRRGFAARGPAARTPTPAPPHKGEGIIRVRVGHEKAPGRRSAAGAIRSINFVGLRFVLVIVKDIIDGCVGSTRYVRFCSRRYVRFDAGGIACCRSYVWLGSWRRLGVIAVVG